MKPCPPYGTMYGICIPRTQVGSMATLQASLSLAEMHIPHDPAPTYLCRHSGTPHPEPKHGYKLSGQADSSADLLLRGQRRRRRRRVGPAPAVVLGAPGRRRRAIARRRHRRRRHVLLQRRRQHADARPLPAAPACKHLQASIRA